MRSRYKEIVRIGLGVAFIAAALPCSAQLALNIATEYPETAC
jgi:hypothetical protein